MTRPAIEKVGFCALCRSRCGAIYSVSGDRLLGVSPAPDHPTGGALCPKGRAAPEIVHGATRLEQPLRRTNPKTDADPGWQPTSWDAALGEVAAKLGQVREESGAEAVAFGVTTPAGTAMSDGIDWVERFIRLFGSPNTVYAAELCHWHKDFAHAYTFGCGIPPADYGGADLILLWGHNPAKVWLAQSSVIAAAQQRGATVAVVDPRRAGSGLRADHWLRVRPGSDGALALCLANLLIQSSAYDRTFVTEWTNAPCLVRDDTGRFLRARELDPALPADWLVGCEGGRPVPYDTARAAVGAERFALQGALAVRTTNGTVQCRPAFERFAAVAGAWSPARTAATTWVPEDQIRALAAVLGEARAVAYHSWTGVGQHTNATQTERALAILYALTGSFDAPGGNVRMPAHPVNPPTSLEQFPPGQRGKALGIAERPLGPPARGWITSRDLYTAILERRPYPVRALMTFGGNMLVSQPDGRRGRDALRQLDFHVHCDLSLNPTAELADLVLPVNSPWEREALRIGFEITREAQELVQLRQRMVPPIGDARSDTEIVFDLAQRLGHGDAFFNGDIEAAWNHVTAPLGLTMADLRRRPEGIRLPLETAYRRYAEQARGGVVGFETETRRVEIYSELLARHGYDAVPRFVEPADSPLAERADARFPLVLTSAKIGRYAHTEHRGVSSLRVRAPEPAVDLSPELAAAKGIEDGEWVVVSTRHAEIRMRARIDASLHPRVVVGEYGWWEAAPDLGLPGYDPFTHEGSSFNLLIGREHCDPVSGAAPLRSYACALDRYAPSDGGALWGGERPFVVAAVVAETPEVVSVTLRPRDGKRLADYRAGQHLTVRIEALSSAGGDASRSYSLTGPAALADRREYRITVKRVHDDTHGRPGSVSGYITSTLRPGDEVQVRAPAGIFSPPTELPHPVVLIAAGIGITPIMSYLETLASAGADQEVVLHYCARNGEVHVFKERIAELADALPGLNVITHYSRPGPHDRCGRDYQLRGRISAQVVAEHLIDRRARVYLCGPLGLVRHFREGLLARGVPSFHVFHELFATPAPSTRLADGVTHQVHFARSRRTATWDGSSRSLLSLAETAGVRLPSGCQVGQCESCAVRVLEGDVHHPLGDYEGSDDGSCLTCQAVPVSDIVLDA